MIQLLDKETLAQIPVVDLAALGIAVASPAAAKTECHSCAAYRTGPELDGNLRVDPEIHLPSPGMNVDIAYYFNANATLTNGPYGYGRTISPNLSLQASGSPTIATLQRGNGAIATYQFNDGYSYNGLPAFISASQNNLNSLTTIPYGGGAAWQETSPEQLVKVFPYDTTGQISSIIFAQDCVGNQHTFAYSSGLLESLQDATGRLVSFAYNGSGLLQSIEDWAARLTTFQYDTLSVPGYPLLTTVIGPTGCQTGYGYNLQGQLTEIVDPNGYATTYAYYGSGYVAGKLQQRSIAGVGMTGYSYSAGWTLVTNPDGTVVTNTLVGDFSMGAVADASGVVTSFQRNSIGQELSRQNLYGAISTILYSPSGLPSGSIDPLGNVTSTIRDAYNNPTTNIYADGSIITNIFGYAGSSFDTTGARRRLQAHIDQIGNISSYAYNAWGELTAKTNPLGQITSYGYDNFGNLTSITDPLGNVSTRLYDLAGNVVGTIDPLGNQSTLAYDPQNRLLSSSDPLGKLTTLAYDSVGNRVLKIDPLGYRTSTIYNVWDKPVSVQDPLGYLTTWSYDLLGRPVAMQNALGYVSTTLYDLAGRPQTSIDALGYAATTLYDLAGRPYASVDQLGNLSTTIYDLAGRVQAQIDARGYATSLGYDARSRPISRQDALGYVTTTQYDFTGRVVAAVDALGRTNTTLYDAAGRVLAQFDPLAYATSFNYDSTGRRTSVQNPRGYLSTVQYDATGRAQAQVSALGYRTSFAYDAAGRQTVMQDALGYRWSSSYDARGSLTAAMNPLGYNTTYSYDALSRQTSYLQLHTTYETNFPHSQIYDALGRVVGTVDPVIAAGGNWRRYTFVYDALGRRTAVEDGLGQRVTSLYDARGSVLSERDSLGAFTSFAYDANANTSLRTDARGIATSYTNDALNRQSQALYPSGKRVTFAFDAVGRQTLMGDSTGITSFLYDNDDRRSAVQYPTGQALTYGYDANGNRLTMLDPSGGLTTYSHDAQDRLSSVLNPWNELTTWAYYPTDLVQKQTMANGVSASHLYNGARWELSRPYITAAGVKRDIYTMAYGGTGAVYSAEGFGDSSGGYAVVYAPDWSSNLLTEQSVLPGDYREIAYSNFGPDLAGNQLNLFNLGTGFVTTYTHNVANELTLRQDPGNIRTTFSYDANGNCTLENQTGALTSYTWDEENRMTGVAYPSGAIETYAYAADGMRRSKQTAAGTTNFVWDDANLLQETDVNLVLQAHYTDFPGYWGGLTSMRRGGVSSFYAFDPLRNARMLFDSSGNITDTYVYYAFGGLFSSSGSTVNPFQWNGQFGYYLDSASRLYVRARHYDTHNYRWPSRDPLWPESYTNPYEYCGNDPVNNVDPEGLQGGLSVAMPTPWGGLSVPSFLPHQFSPNSLETHAGQSWGSLSPTSGDAAANMIDAAMVWGASGMTRAQRAACIRLCIIGATGVAALVVINCDTKLGECGPVGLSICAALGAASLAAGIAQCNRKCYGPAPRGPIGPTRPKPNPTPEPL